MNVKKDISIVIPTYNGSRYLPEVLNALRNQEGLKEISWEVIVVDNNSTDTTPKIVEEFQKKWDMDNKLRYLVEKRQGAAYARETGVRNAKSKIIGFLDDDNIPEKNWILEAYRFGSEHHEAGAWGSRIKARYEKMPPENFDSIKMYFAIMEKGENAYCSEAKKFVLPPSAGLVVRKDIWPASPLLLTGRTKETWLAGEDIELLVRIQNKGYGIWYNPRMEITHIIPAARLEPEYAINLMKGIGLCKYITRMLRQYVLARPVAIVGYCISDFLKMMKFMLRFRAKIIKDALLKAEFFLYLYSFYSPFYFLFRYPKKFFLIGK